MATVRAMAADDIASWAASGAMALTGRADGPPLVAPAGLAAAARSAAEDVADLTGRFGARVEVDGPALLGERAALAGFGRAGSVSVGGAARFEEAADGWVVLNLPRPEDVDALPALLELDCSPEDWAAVADAIRERRAADLVDRGRLLGLAVAMPGEQPPATSPGRELTRGRVRRPTPRPLVIDLTSLWAGPLAGSILAAAGARVIKVEGRARPDGAREGPTAFFDLLNAGKEMLALDFADVGDIALLRRLIAAADLVIEGSRPRVMDQLGIHPTMAAADTATSWLSITAHGRTHDPDRIGFGDDAAVAGGLWTLDDDGPGFVADAVADPLTGLAAAALGAELLAADRAAVLETPLSRVAAWARPRPVVAEVVADEHGGWEVMTAHGRVPVAAPRARVATSRAASFDAHGAALRDEFA